MASYEHACLSGRTLSKTGLYSPLAIVNLDKNQSKKKNRSAGKDGALIDFIFQIGKDYHRKASIRFGKNNGCKAVSHSEVKEKISQRALTLIGGGINTSISKGIHKQGIKLCYKSSKAITRKKKAKAVVNYSKKLTWDNVTLMNHYWNLYIQDHLQEIQFPDRTNIIKILHELERSEIEWTGAEVHVISCLSNRNYDGYTGILIQCTTNTWRVAVKASGNEYIELCVIPKTGSRIEVKMPECFAGSKPGEITYMGIE
mmetsp:Transcript_18664/g.28211  ORF Transcript_18664/g.28211 Transcript_18664/m.28211 type:complete len:257 (-) Transcript_18664:68-838(-)